MKKRFMTGVVAAVTALAMSVSALAAGSIVGTIDMPNASTDKGTIANTISRIQSKYLWIFCFFRVCLFRLHRKNPLS